MKYRQLFVNYIFKYSHKKRKDRLEGSLDRVLLATELEFSKILVPRLSQHISVVNIGCAGKSEWSNQLYSLYVTSFLEHWYILILLFWYWSVFNWWCLVWTKWYMVAHLREQIQEYDFTGIITYPLYRTYRSWKKILLQLLLKTGR